MPEQLQRRTRALLFLCVGTLTFGFSSVLIRLCALPSGMVASLRMLIAGLVLLPFVTPGIRAIVRGRGIRSLLPLLVPGLLLGLHFHLWVAGVRQTSVATATFIFATNPVLFAVAELAVYRRRLSAADWFAIALAAAGGAWLMASGGSGSSLAGAALCLAATVMFVLYLVASEKVSSGTPHPTYVCLIYLAGGLLTLPLALARGEAMTPAWTDGSAWLALAALALLSTLVGHASNTYAVRFFPPILVSFTTLLEPILSSIAALAVLGERPPTAEYPSYALFAAATALFLAARWVRGRSTRSRCSTRGPAPGKSCRP
ncbi:MAG: DMT family transporter [Spirochaetes bacterium]|nr:DMT family transporter [Spirochaetota bacterium]